MIRLLNAIWAHPARTLFGLVLLTSAALFALVDPVTGTLRLRIDPSVSRLLPEADEARAFYERVRYVFGSDETVVIVLAGADAFAPERLERLAVLGEALAELPGVHRVTSLATVPNVSAEGDRVELRSFVDLASDANARERLRADALANPLVRGALVSADGSAAAIAVSFRGLSDDAFREERLTERIRALAEEAAGDAEVWITGVPVVKAETSRALVRSLAIALPAIAAVAMIVLGFAFRSLRGIGVPLLTIAVALVWTLAVTAALDRSLNLVTVIVPPLVITLGLAYAMHVVSEIEERLARGAPGETARRGVLEGMREVALPVAVTGLTTAAGLAALAASPVPAIREFAGLSVVGVVCALLLSLTLIPALFGLRGARSRPRPAAAGFARVADRLAGFDLAHRRRLLGAGLAVLVLAAAGAARIEVGTQYIGNFPRDSRVRSDYAAINEALAGANLFYVVVEGHVDDAFVEPELLRELAALETWLEEQPEIGGVTSLADHLRLLHRSFHEGRDEAFRLPESANVAKQLLVFGAGDEIESVVDKRFRTTNLAVRAKVEDTASIANLVRRVEARLDELPPPLSARVTGSTILVTRTVDAIAGGQLRSLGAALLVIYGVLAALFTSWRVGGIALLPNALPVAVYFGALGWSGITLNPSTSLIACIALGIAVDDTIHYFVRFNAEARRTGSEEEGTRRALRAVIRPVTFTTLALVAGFLVLGTSELRSQAQFGVLAAFTMAVAWVADLTLTPALGAGVRIVTLWDVLRLDLGPEPHRSIPLFTGLTPRQARIFALLSDIRAVPAGTRLLSEGEEGKDLYVVVDGELLAWIEREGGRIELSRMGRGAVVGEVGYFVQKRTANVDAVSDARLIRFEPEDLERMRRRYPRIAAAVYANLNRIQAERMARATQRVR